MEDRYMATSKTTQGRWEKFVGSFQECAEWADKEIRNNNGESDIRIRLTKYKDNAKKKDVAEA